jgi:hypothetical protein
LARNRVMTLCKFCGKFLDQEMGGYSIYCCEGVWGGFGLALTAVAFRCGVGGGGSGVAAAASRRAFSAAMAASSCCLAAA